MSRHCLRLVIAMTLLLGGCSDLRRPTPGAHPPPLMQPVPGARLYEVQPGQSLVRILVYRGGALASAGHNHVIASHEVTGRIYLHPDIARSALEITMPVMTLTVDEPQLRVQAGEDFPPQVPERARRGTRDNMVGPELLDGEHFPAVRLVSRGVEGGPSHPTVHLKVGIRDRWSNLSVPLSLARDEHALTATGEFTVKQTALGLQPFSALLGALKVQDELRVKFSIRATADR